MWSAVLLAGVFRVSVEAAVQSALDTAYAPDGKTLAVTDATSPGVVLIDPANRKILRKIGLSGSPAGLAWSGDCKQLFVAEAGAGTIAVVNPATGAIARRLSTGRYPHGLAVANRRNILIATDWGVDQVAVIDLASGKTTARINTGRQPTTVAITPDESLAVVSNLLPATAALAADHAVDISLIDLNTLKPRPPVRLPLGSTNARGIAISRDGRTAYVAHALGRFHLPTTQLDRGWVNTNAVSIIDLSAGKLTATLLLDQMMDGAADPWGVALDPEGKRLAITLSGVHQIAIIDLTKLPDLLAKDPAALANDLSALHSRGMIQRLNLPAQGPRGIAVSPDGKGIAVAGYFSGNIVMLDANGGNPEAIALGKQEKPDLVRRGEMAFHNANLCYQRWLSCATCHPGARADGLNWDLLNDGMGNPKNTRSMVFSHRTPPVMSLGVRASMEVAARAGFVHIQFTEPKPDELKAVIAYLQSLEPVASPHLTPSGGLSPAAKRGKILFNDPGVGCVDCHTGPMLTNKKMSDVGTLTTRDSGAEGIDTPALVELWRTPPYLHDGRAATLRDVLVTHNRSGDHGDTSDLKPEQIDDLIAYLNSL